MGFGNNNFFCLLLFSIFCFLTPIRGEKLINKGGNRLSEKNGKGKGKSGKKGR